MHFVSCRWKVLQMLQWKMKYFMRNLKVLSVFMMAPSHFLTASLVKPMTEIETGGEQRYGVFVLFEWLWKNTANILLEFSVFCVYTALCQHM